MLRKEGVHMGFKWLIIDVHVDLTVHQNHVCQEQI